MAKDLDIDNGDIIEGIKKSPSYSKLKNKKTSYLTSNMRVILMQLRKAFCQALILQNFD